TLLYLVDSPLVGAHVEGHGQLREAVEDDIYLHLRFENGVRAHLHTSWLWPTKERRLTIVGEKAMVSYDEIAKRGALDRGFIDDKLENVDDGEEIVFAHDGEPLHFELDYFLRRLHDRKPPRTGGKSALEVIKLLARISRTTEPK